MKPYEEIAYLKQKIGWMGGKRNSRFNNVENLKRDLARVKEEHAIIEKTYIDEIKLQEKDLDALEILLDDLKEQYKKALEREYKKPPPKKSNPKPVEDIKKDEEGKIACGICGEFYAPQGIRSHEIACRRKKLEDELASLG